MFVQLFFIWITPSFAHGMRACEAVTLSLNQQTAAESSWGEEAARRNLRPDQIEPFLRIQRDLWDSRQSLSYWNEANSLVNRAVRFYLNSTNLNRSSAWQGALERVARESGISLEALRQRLPTFIRFQIPPRGEGNRDEALFWTELTRLGSELASYRIEMLQTIEDRFFLNHEQPLPNRRYIDYPEIEASHSLFVSESIPLTSHLRLNYPGARGIERELPTVIRRLRERPLMNNDLRRLLEHHMDFLDHFELPANQLFWDFNLAASIYTSRY